VNLFQLEDTVALKVQALLDRYLRSLTERVNHSSSFRALSGILLSYAEMTVMIGAGFEVLIGRLTIGGLFGFLGAYSRVVRAVESLNSMVPSLASFEGQLSRIREFELAAMTDAPAASGDSMILVNAFFSIGGQTILNRCAFSAGVGEKVLVVGPN